MNLSDINSAPAFVSFMKEIWNMNATPAAGGGIHVSQHPDYPLFHNARRVATLAGAKRTGSSKLGEKGAHVLAWPDGSRAVVTYDGSACKITYRKYTPKVQK